ncbi:MAG: 16S rRNA (cytidine(1402)-2'-O)-methyltransferase [Oscillospiraceae bacterium]|nr:16S rRNA (cytidine(1402)-2'-O)-methyltransferase [Oscillospiraceae bacterium]
MGKLYVVATPIGNLSDISPRAIETLKNVQLIAAEDTRRTLQLLNHFNIRTPVTSYHKFNEIEKSAELIDKVLNGLEIALVSDAGTPCISDPGCFITALARKNHIEIIGIPGPSAVTTALSISGFIFDKFCFLGFIKKGYCDLIIKSDFNIFVLFESPNRIVDSLAEMYETIGECDVLVVNDISKLYEKSTWGKLSDVAQTIKSDANAELGEYTIVINYQRENTITEDEISIEALLIDEMIKTNCSMKEAIASVSKNKNISKNDAYKASLNLKNKGVIT